MTSALPNRKNNDVKRTFIPLIFIAAAATANACDICGCGVGNGYIGILPEFRKHIFGLRYRHNSVLTHLGVGGERTYLTTRESYATAEAWGGWTLGDKFRLMASVPYGFNQRVNGGTANSKSGVGDVTLSGYYQLLNKRQSTGSNLLVQSLWVGGGVKLATGGYSAQDKDAGANSANLFQLGTGSTDFNLGFMYDLRLQDAGINLSSNYKLTTVNRYSYRYGNKFGGNAQAYYKFRVKKKATVAPNVGMVYERSEYDREKSLDVWASGGNLLLATVGVETSFDRFAFGANVQRPLSQNLANGIVKAGNRMMVHVAVAL